MNYETPGVYTEEISTFPPSVAQVETAIPVFIGHTENGESLEPTRITSLLEYEQQFGGQPKQTLKVTLSNDGSYLPQSVDCTSPYLMYYALQMFYANGGGPCYIASVDTYNGNLNSLEDDSIKSKCFKKISKIDEITLIVIPEAVKLDSSDQYGSYKRVLTQCNELKDRFGIFDVRKDDTDGTDFRSGIGTSYLSYGAAYYPYLKTSIPYNYTADSVKFSHSGPFDTLSLQKIQVLSKALSCQNNVDKIKTSIDKVVNNSQSGNPGIKALKPLYRKAESSAEKAIEAVTQIKSLITDENFKFPKLDDANKKFTDGKDVPMNNKGKIKKGIQNFQKSVQNVQQAIDNIIAELNSQTGVPKNINQDIEDYFTKKFQSALNKLLNQETVTLPPSSTMAGIYARVDNNRGVWKAPANVSINRVTGPSKKLTMEQTDNLNVDTTGKSINVIRAFTGKGTLVWGARTLDGNSNEWRYISVRRFFNMVEESCKEASSQFVFEPNNANTWVKVKGMIENFLTLQWRAGALMGATPDQAFYVKVGLGKTMTQQDINNGRLIVEIGMAAVRPAEFIILRFSHKMIES